MTAPPLGTFIRPVLLRRPWRGAKYYERKLR